MLSRFFQIRYVMYDGSCGFCREALEVLGWMNLLRLVVAYDVTSQWPLIHQRFPQLDREQSLRDIHVVESGGRVQRGFDAYRSLAWVLPPLWPLLPAIYLPPVRELGQRMYRRIADHR